MMRRPPRSTQSRSSAASDVYKRQSSRSCCSYLQPIETLLSTPVIFKDQVMGVIQVLNRTTEDMRKRKGGRTNVGGSTRRQQRGGTDGGTRSSVKAAMLMSVTGCSPTNISADPVDLFAVSYTHLRAHETVLDLVCRLLLEKKKTKSIIP
eukprot:TRINITY_DN4136_c0_g1_i1.p1 TRINITY_DN4136_c0_g1~~TRINITY_DN4136_c0_g1_i1.p1  ORF type:complete len:150 (-),score=57.39 TRINITY_DN4136_c0_g1_i1:36-485(-)